MRSVQLKDMMQAVLVRYDGWLYNAALVKFIYLLDIESVRRRGIQITAIKWERDNYGPYVWDVMNCARRYPTLFRIEVEGEKRRIICTDSQREVPVEIEALIDEVVARVPSPKDDFLGFKEYVYATPPMVLSRGYGPLDIQTAMEADKDVQETVEMLDTPEWNEALAYLAAN